MGTKALDTSWLIHENLGVWFPLYPWIQEIRNAYFKSENILYSLLIIVLTVVKPSEKPNLISHKLSRGLGLCNISVQYSRINEHLITRCFASSGLKYNSIFK